MMHLKNSASLRLLFLGIFLSALGASLSSIGFSLLAAQAQQSSLLASVLLAHLVPTIVFSLPGGHIADKKLRWWWWPVSLLLTALVTTLMALDLSWPVIIAGSVFNSSSLALIGPVAQKLVAAYSEDSVRAGAQLATAQGSATVLGVALGGLSFAAGALQIMLLADAAAALILAVIALVVATPEAIRIDQSDGGKGIFTGIVILKSPKVFGGLGLVLIITTVLSTSLDDVAGVFALTQALNLSPYEYGFTSAEWALGIVVGSIVGRYIQADPLKKYPWTALPIGIALAAVGLFAPGFQTIMVLFLIGGAGNGCFNAVGNRIILSSVPKNQQGRAWSAYRWIIHVLLLVGYLAGAVFGSDYPLELMAWGGSSLVLCALINILVRAYCGLDHQP